MSRARRKRRATRRTATARKTVKRASTTTVQKSKPRSVVTVVNMIPNWMSDEHDQQSEPHLTVNPANPNQIVGTVLAPNPNGGALTPLYVSQDGGFTWDTRAIVPSIAGGVVGTHDISSSFNATGTMLYTGILRDPTWKMELLRTNNVLGTTAMTVLESLSGGDQPFAHATTSAGTDRVFFGYNDLSVFGTKTAAVRQSQDGAVAAPPGAFPPVYIERRIPYLRNGARIRPVAHADGTVYAAYLRWTSTSGYYDSNSMIVTADVEVVRDNAWGTRNYADLIDPTDGIPGQRVIRNVRYPNMKTGTYSTGQQRIGTSLTIAVDPTNSQTAWISWGDLQGFNKIITLHVRRSTNGGQTWGADLLAVPNAINGALAVNSAGVVGFLYQELSGTGSAQRWVTWFRFSADGINWTNFVLATVPALTPLSAFDPYIGDYDHLVAVGADFYGIFSANNTPDLANFPNGVTYQRNKNFTTRTLYDASNTTPVAVSIDPFFFKVTP